MVWIVWKEFKLVSWCMSTFQKWQYTLLNRNFGSNYSNTFQKARFNWHGVSLRQLLVWKFYYFRNLLCLFQIVPIYRRLYFISVLVSIQTITLCIKNKSVKPILGLMSRGAKKHSPRCFPWLSNERSCTASVCPFNVRS